jgi:hypothetical protein
MSAHTWKICPKCRCTDPEGGYGTYDFTDGSVRVDRDFYNNGVSGELVLRLSYQCIRDECDFSHQVEIIARAEGDLEIVEAG